VYRVSIGCYGDELMARSGVSIVYLSVAMETTDGTERGVYRVSVGRVK